MRLSVLSVFLFFLFVNGCDPYFTAEFNVDNQHSKDIKVLIKGYTSYPAMGVDTTFIIPSQTKSIILIDQGLGPPMEHLVQSGKLAFCTSIKMSCDTVVSPRDPKKIGEWVHEEGGNYSEGYTLIVTTDDFGVH